MSSSCPVMFVYVWWIELCFQFQRYELPPSTSIVSAMILLTHGRSEYALCPPSCCTLNPMPATANPSATASSPTAHQLVAKSNNPRYAATNHAMIVKVFKYIDGQSRRR